LEHAHDGIEVACQRAEAAATTVAGAVEEGLSKLEHARQNLDAKVVETADKLRKIADDLLEASTSRLELQADQVAELLRQKLSASQASVILEANAKLAANGRSFLQYITKDADTIAAQFRRQLEQSARASVLVRLRH